MYWKFVLLYSFMLFLSRFRKHSIRVSLSLSYSYFFNFYFACKNVIVLSESTNIWIHHRPQTASPRTALSLSQESFNVPLSLCYIKPGPLAVKQKTSMETRKRYQSFAQFLSTKKYFSYRWSKPTLSLIFVGFPTQNLSLFYPRKKNKLCSRPHQPIRLQLNLCIYEKIILTAAYF